MGNNHDKYFGKDKRKILVLGLPKSGKTKIIDLIAQGKQSKNKVQQSKDLSIRDAKVVNLNVTFFQVAGGQRQRVFWKQHYEGTQGIIFVIDCTNVDMDVSIEQLLKISQIDVLQNIPLGICLHKCDLSDKSKIDNMKKNIQSKLKSVGSLKKGIFITSISNKKSIVEMMTWLLKETKPL